MLHGSFDEGADGVHCARDGEVGGVADIRRRNAIEHGVPGALIAPVEWRIRLSRSILHYVLFIRETLDNSATSFSGGTENEKTCGVVRFDHLAAEHLIAQLPKLLQVDAWHDDEGSWLHSTLRFISREAKELPPGGETVITRLADILVIQMIRSWIDSAPEASQGWLAALRDEQVGRALTSTRFL